MYSPGLEPSTLRLNRWLPRTSWSPLYHTSAHTKSVKICFNYFLFVPVLRQPKFNLCNYLSMRISLKMRLRTKLSSTRFNGILCGQKNFLRQIRSLKGWKKQTDSLSKRFTTVTSKREELPWETSARQRRGNTCRTDQKRNQHYKT